AFGGFERRAALAAGELDQRAHLPERFVLRCRSEQLPSALRLSAVEQNSCTNAGFARELFRAQRVAERLERALGSGAVPSAVRDGPRRGPRRVARAPRPRAGCPARRAPRAAPARARAPCAA